MSRLHKYCKHKIQPKLYPRLMVSLPIRASGFLTRRYDFENKERICVIGHSTGALITLLASLKDKRIKFGSVVTTVTCLKDSFLYWFESGFNQEVKEFFKAKTFELAPKDFETTNPYFLAKLSVFLLAAIKVFFARSRHS